MRRIGCPRTAWVFALAGLTLAANALAGDDPATSPAGREKEKDRPPVNVFVDKPADLSTLLNSLTRPDFVILNGDEYAKLLGKLKALPTATKTAGVVESFEVRGTAAGDLADLTAEAVVSTEAESDASVWVSLRLDGQTLTGATADGKEVPLRVGDGGGWQVELKGKGKHRVGIGLAVPLRPTPEGTRLELAIPEAASTRVEVSVTGRVAEARTGPNEPLIPTPPDDKGMARLRADLTPRGRLALIWRRSDTSAGELPPLLSARGEVAIDFDSGTFRARSSWSVRSLRGSARTLEMRLDPDDELLEIDGHAPDGGVERVGGSTRIVLPLATPLEPGQERRVVLTTRRGTAAGASARVTYRGVVFVNAREQAGSIGVTRGVNLWVSGTAGRGVRQVDPRTELPADLRGRPGTELAYQFTEQPFELTLRAEPSPPLLRAESRTTVTLDPKSARIDTRIDFRAVRGRPFEVVLRVAADVEVESIEPDGVVDPGPIGGPTRGPRLITVRPGPTAQEGGRFTVHVVGVRPIDPKGDVAIGLFQPLGAIDSGGRIAVVADPSLTADLNEREANARSFRAALTPPPADWPWPSGRAPAAGAAPSLWLRHDESPPTLPLDVYAHARSVSHAVALIIAVGRREADVTEEIETAVRFGTLDHIDLAIPPALDGRWSVEGSGVAQRVDLGADRQGVRAVRLRLSGEPGRTNRLKLRYKLPVGPGPGQAELTFPWIGTVGPSDGLARLTASVSAEPGLSVTATGTGWAGTRDETGGGDDPSAATRLSAAEGAGPLLLKVTTRALATLPRLVVPRLGLSTVGTPEGELRTHAAYWVEAHDAAFSLALPPGARLQQAKVGGVALERVEDVDGSGGVRLVFPARVGTAPTLVELEYLHPAPASGAKWVAPRLLDGGVVQQTLWEARLPLGRAAIGVPTGWNDENEWFWDVYLWKRRPPEGLADLTRWVSGGGAKAEETAPRGETHRYLFGRQGGPIDLPLETASRVVLVAVCSGLVMVAGSFLVVARRRDRPAIGAGLALASAAGLAFLPSSVTLLTIQSGLMGLPLTALVAVTQRVVERRRSRSSAFESREGRPAVIAPGSSLNRVFGDSETVGSDDSTAIRSRPLVPSAPASTTSRNVSADGPGLGSERRAER